MICLEYFAAFPAKSCNGGTYRQSIGNYGVADEPELLGRAGSVRPALAGGNRQPTADNSILPAVGQMSLPETQLGQERQGEADPTLTFPVSGGDCYEVNITKVTFGNPVPEMGTGVSYVRVLPQRRRLQPPFQRTTKNSKRNLGPDALHIRDFRMCGGVKSPPN